MAEVCSSLSSVEGLSKTWPGLYSEASGRATPNRQGSASPALPSPGLLPITDVVLVGPRDPVPAGYVKLERTATNRRAQLHAYSRADQPLHLCVRRARGGRGGRGGGGGGSSSSSSSATASPVTAVLLSADQHGEPLPPGFVRVDRTPAGRCACLRAEKGGSALVLCIKRGGAERGGGDAIPDGDAAAAAAAFASHPIDAPAAPPLTDINFVQTNKGEAAPPGYVSCTHSPSGRDTTVLAGKGGGALVLVFQQDYTGLARQVGIDSGGASKSASTTTAQEDFPVLIRALYSRDPKVVRVALNSLRGMIAGDDDHQSSVASAATTTSFFTSNPSAVSVLVSALCDAADAHPSHHLDPILYLLERMVRLPKFLESGNTIDAGAAAADNASTASPTSPRPPPRNLLRIMGSLVFLYSLFGDDNMAGTSSSSADAVRRTTSTCMAVLMQRVDATNPLGADLIIEKRLLSEAAAHAAAIASTATTADAANNGSGDAVAAATFAVEVILAHVHELRSSMVAAHDAVIATLTLAGQHHLPTSQEIEARPVTYTTAAAPYSERWCLEMDGIGRRLFSGHEPPRAVFDTIAFLCQIAHASVVERDADEPSAEGSNPGGYVPKRQSDLRTKVGALRCLRILLEAAGLGFRHGDSCGLVVRGLVVQCVLENCPLQSMRVFKEVLSLLTVLWTSFRRHLKVELTILFNDVILRVLRSPHAPPQRKVEVLKQLIDQWFAQPANLVELYLNFDNDQVNATDANIYGGMCEVLCALAEGRAYGASTREKQLAYYAEDSDDGDNGLSDDGVGYDSNDDGGGGGGGARAHGSLASRRRRLRRVALDALARITRCLMDTSATIHLMHRVNKDKDQQSISVGGDGRGGSGGNGGNSEGGGNNTRKRRGSGPKKHEAVNWDMQTSTFVGDKQGGDSSSSSAAGRSRGVSGTSVISEGRYSPYESSSFDGTDVVDDGGADGRRSGGTTTTTTTTTSYPPGPPTSTTPGGAFNLPLPGHAGTPTTAITPLHSSIPRNTSFSSNESGGSARGSPPMLSDSKVSAAKAPRVRSASDFGPAIEKIAGAAASSLTPQPESTTHGLGRHGRNGARPMSLARHGRRASVRLRHDLRQEKIGIAEKAIALAHRKSLRKALDLLLESGHVSPSPGEFCNWIRDHIDAIDDTVVGDYLGEDGLEPVSPSGEMAPSHRTTAFMLQFRDTFIGAMSFAGMGFVPALRHMLTQGGFRIPGEAQKIERILQSFATCYYAANKDSLGDVEDADVVLVLAFATVMLNTDMYNKAIKKSRKMTLTQFKGNMRGQGVSNAILQSIWNDISAEEIQMPKAGQAIAAAQSKQKKDKGGSSSASGGSDGGGGGGGGFGETSESLKTFERSMMNAAQGARAKLSGHAAMCRVYFTKMSTELVNLMFEISWPFFYRCITMVLDEEESRNGRQRRKERENGGRLNSVDSDAMTRPGHLELVACVLDLLRYSISACLCLGMETERRAFAALLAKFHFLHSNTGEWDSIGDVMVFAHEESSRDARSASDGGDGGSGHAGGSHTFSGSSSSSSSSSSTKHRLKRGNTVTRDLLSGKHLEQTWFKHVMQTSAHDSEAVMDVISEVHQLASCLRDRVMLEHKSRSLVRVATLRFVRKDAEQILNFQGHSNRLLIKEGALVRHTQSGKRKRYRFFLFSDLFLYASGGGRSKLKVHNFLPLESLGVRGVVGDGGGGSTGASGSTSTNNADAMVSFHIESPVKSFAVSATSAARKRGWVRAIKGACRQLEIDQLEAIKKKMLKRAVEDDKMAHSGRAVQRDSPEAKAATPKELVKGMGGKRISMIDRYEMRVNAAESESQDEQNARKRQSTAMRSIDVSGGGASTLPSRSPMSDEELEALFKKALAFSRAILEGTHEKYEASDAQKLVFYALFKQAVAGDCTVSQADVDKLDWIKKAKVEAWKEQSGSSTRSAQARFLELLEMIAPDWAGAAK